MTAHSQFPSQRKRDGGVVVVGAGLAGLFTALKLAPLPVTVVSAGAHSAKAPPASGRRRASPRRSPRATRPRRTRPTPSAPAPASSMTRSRISWRARRATASRICCRYGVPFDKDLEGHFSLGREAAHGRNRILHVKGDTAGRAIMAALFEAVQAHAVDHRARRLCRPRSSCSKTAASRASSLPPPRLTSRRLGWSCRRAPWCWRPAAPARSTPSPPIRARRAAKASPSPPGPAR